ncbi:MAG TPA: TIR domain-containing protein [Vicinamibacterales bacterium]|nr:TIR domain-containing protein [Vicinamibacterales bacterium]
MVNPRVLIADDKADQLETWSGVLEDAGFSVLAARSVSEVRDILDGESQPDLAVLDLHLNTGQPNDLSGLLLAKEFSSDRLPIILFSDSLTVKALLALRPPRGSVPTPGIDVVSKEEGAPALVDAVRAAYKPRVFVAHGRDLRTKQEVVEFLQGSRTMPVSLESVSGTGQVLIEKFVRNANVHFAVVLMTPDDVGRCRKGEKKFRHRARQNVIFELGYFLGKLGRNRVAALYREDGEKLELPSNYEGVAMIRMEEDAAWKEELSKVLTDAGLKK